MRSIDTKRECLLASDGVHIGYILLVAQSGPSRDATEAVLQAAGLAVACSIVEEVFLALDLMPPKLVLFDDGDEGDRAAALKRLRGHPALQGVPVVVLSKESGIDSFGSAITGGAAAYLVKPVHDEALISVARRLCGWTGRGDETEKRRRLRRPLLMQVEVESRSDKRQLHGEIVDASSGGCRVELAEALPKGAIIRIVLCAPDELTYLALGGEVRWQRALENGKFAHGVRFTGTTALLAARVLGFTAAGGTP
jgi:CheY-like chemotaxis protein